MDLVLIAIIISALVLVLQIITLVRIAGTQKTLTRLQTVPQPMPSNDRDRMGRRDNDFRRHDRKPIQDQKQRPQPQQPLQQQQQQQQQQQPQQPSAGSSPAPAAGDGLEKSLRDINLRLKNAERDQESARRRMQENMPRDGYRNRDDRDRGRHRGGRDRHDRHGNRDSNRGNWQDRRDRQDRQNRPPQSFPQNQAAPAIAPAAPSSEPLFEKKENAPLEPVMPVQEMTPVTNIQENIKEQSPSDYGSEEALQHGRKIIVKRRPLSTDESADAPLENGQTSSQPAAAEVSGPEEETTMGSDSPGSEIKFGRR
jgi:hypothetical protein